MIDQAEQWIRPDNRLEVRRLWAFNALNYCLKWLGLKQVLKIERKVEKKGQKEPQAGYAIASPGPATGARKLLSLVCGHWAIEDKLFQVSPQGDGSLKNTV